MPMNFVNYRKFSKNEHEKTCLSAKKDLLWRFIAPA